MLRSLATATGETARAARLVVLAVMLGHVASAFLAARADATCPEHGALLDAWPALAAGADGASWDAAPSGLAPGEHECWVLASFPDAFGTGVAPRPAISSAVRGAASIALCDAPRPAAVAMYRVAPKSSPPA